MPYKRNFTILAATASSGPPSIADETLGGAKPFSCDIVHLLVKNAVGTGALSVTMRLWGYNTETDRWYDLGLLNQGVAIGPSDTDIVSYAQGVAGTAAFDRLYIEIEGAVGGGGSPTFAVEGICVQETR